MMTHNDKQNMDSKHRNDKVKELAKLIKEKEDEWKTETDALQKEYVTARPTYVVCCVNWGSCAPHQCVLSSW